MPTSTAKLSSYRQSPRKVRLIADLVRGKSVMIALVELAHGSKRAAPVFEKLIRSAVANAKVLGMDEKTLVVKEIRVDKGLTMHRFMPKAHGRASRFDKHSSNIILTLAVQELKNDKNQMANSKKSVPKTKKIKKATK